MEASEILKSYTDKRLMQSEESWTESLRELKNMRSHCKRIKLGAARALGITDGPLAELTDHLEDTIVEIGVLLADILIEEARRRSLRQLGIMKEEDK